jgi:hypothetical protein
VTTTVRPSPLNLPTVLTVVVVLFYAWVGFASAGVDGAAGLLGPAALPALKQAARRRTWRSGCGSERSGGAGPAAR